MFRITHSNDFRLTKARLRRLHSKEFFSDLNKFGARGIAALRAATPKDSGDTANAWYYKINKTPTTATLVWCNRVLIGDVPLAVLLQYGYGTRQGAFVEGRDYINPALASVFDDIAEDMWAALKQ